MPQTQIHGTQIQSDSVDSHVFAPGSIDGSSIQNNTITDSHLVAGIEPSKISVNDSNYTSTTLDAALAESATNLKNHVETLNSAIVSNKTDADTQFTNINSAITTNKTDADTQFTNINTTIIANKTDADTAISGLQSEKAALNGNLTIPFNMQGLNSNGHILPNADATFDIGSSTTRFRSLYVNEAHLSTNTLYIGDTAVMGTDATTVVIKADPDQSITMKTTATGTTSIISEAGVLMSTSGMNANVTVQTTGAGSRVIFGAQTEVDMTAPNVNINGSLAVSGGAQVDDMTVNGNLTVKGAVMNVQTQTVEVSDNMMILNNGETGAGVTAGQSGLQIDRGTLGAYYMVFDETDDMFKVGMTGQLQTIASQNWVDNNTHPATIIAQDANHNFVTQDQLNKFNNMKQAITGSSNFLGTSNGVTINFASPLANTNYSVSTTPTSATDGQLGDVWVIKSTTGIQVFNTGSYVGPFDYTVLY